MDKYLEFKNICNNQDNYPTRSDLIYKFGFTPDEVRFIQQQKFNDDSFLKLNLKDQTGRRLLYWNNEKIVTNFLGSHDIIRNSNLLSYFNYNDSEIINGFIFSEIESSLSIEGIRSTRAQIEKLNKTDYDDITNINDIIIKNMLLGYEFVKNNKITEENIYKLYNILSKKSLKEQEQLLNGNYYRHDEVDIVDSTGTVVDRGVNHKLLPQLMKDLITFIKKEKSQSEHLIASHIIHYYLVFIHPYFDYNGRMARVLSFWYNYQNAPSFSLLLANEAINNVLNKNNYYNAIINSRQMDNDITYFLEYMGNIILNYSKLYINYYHILQTFKNKGVILPRSIENAIKVVLNLSSVDNNYFSWKDYHHFTNNEFTKQYYLKLLNNLVDLKILETKDDKKIKLFKLNRNILIF